MSATKEYGTVHVACEIFSGFHNIKVPGGTEVFRHVINGKPSSWFLEFVGPVPNTNVTPVQK